mmetsp:Transcript_39015/g.126125  ORF Transcript_39015/g.126125 Transcript_39015/m.126125 type:complete len:432 (-) Transcript_39015:643-1938(-)
MLCAVTTAAASVSPGGAASASASNAPLAPGSPRPCAHCDTDVNRIARRSGLWAGGAVWLFGGAAPPTRSLARPSRARTRAAADGERRKGSSSSSYKILTRGSPLLASCAARHLSPLSGLSPSPFRSPPFPFSPRPTTSRSAVATLPTTFPPHDSTRPVSQLCVSCHGPPSRMHPVRQTASPRRGARSARPRHAGASIARRSRKWRCAAASRAAASCRASAAKLPSPHPPMVRCSTNSASSQQTAGTAPGLGGALLSFRRSSLARSASAPSPMTRMAVFRFTREASGLAADGPAACCTFPPEEVRSACSDAFPQNTTKSPLCRAPKPATATAAGVPSGRSRRRSVVAAASHGPRSASSRRCTASRRPIASTSDAANSSTPAASVREAARRAAARSGGSSPPQESRTTRRCRSLPRCVAAGSPAARSPEKLTV